MALKPTTPVSPSSHSHFPHLSTVHSPPYILFTRYTFVRPNYPAISLRKSCYFLYPVPLKVLSTGRSKRYTKSTEESTDETSTDDNDDDDSGEESYQSSDDLEKATTGSSKRNTSLSDALNLSSRDPVYEVVEVSSKGMVSTRKVSRRHLLKSSGLRPRDIRSVDPSLWLTNTMPSLL